MDNKKEDTIYIMKEDFSYFEVLHRSLDEERRKRFLDILVEKAVTRSVGDAVPDER